MPQGQNGDKKNILIKKGILMKWVKQAVGYWCDDTEKNYYTGGGICAALLDTGISAHPDLRERIVDFRDFTDSGETYISGTCRDDSGHGTHVAGKVLDREGNGNVENVLKGIEWILEVMDRYDIRIVNISVGTQPDLASGQKQALLDAVEDLWDNGLVVVVSAGNYGPREGTVAVPGNSRKVITVGVPDAEPPVVARRKRKLNYSGRGPTGECIVKPDVFAPGTGIISCNAAYGRSGEHPYIMKTGTSMATPVVSGAVACLLSKYPDMSNVEVKLKLRESCTKSPGTEAGWGLLNVERLLSAF